MNRLKSRICLRQILCLMASVGLMILIYLFSGQTAEASSAVSSPFAEFLLSVIQKLPEDMAVFIVRKGAHFSIYAALGFLLFYALVPTIRARKKPFNLLLLLQAASSWLICTIYAVSDEFHQLYVPGRSGEFRDIVLDSCGSLSGLLIALILFVQLTKISIRRRNRIRNSAPAPEQE